MELHTQTHVCKLHTHVYMYVCLTDTNSVTYATFLPMRTKYIYCEGKMIQFPVRCRWIMDDFMHLAVKVLNLKNLNVGR